VDTMIIGYALGVISCAIYVALAGRCGPVAPPPDVPKRPVLVYCADCDERTEMKRDGSCAKCNRNSVALAAKLPPVSDDWAPALTVEERIAANRKLARAAVLRRRPATMVEIGGVQ
jgi:hypothetical protein